MRAAQGTRWCRRWAAPWVAILVVLGATPGWARPRKTVKGAVAAQVGPTRQVRASLTLKVVALDSASMAVRAAALRHGAVIAQERRSHQQDFTLRLAPERVDRLLAALGTLGETNYREAAADDPQPTLNALARRRAHLEAELKRTEAAVAGVRQEGDASRLQQVLNELRAELEEVEAQWVQVQDAVALATVQVSLVLDAPVPEPTVSDRDILFYPGLRFSSLLDVGNRGTVGLWGLGLSLQPKQWLSFEVDFYRAATALSGREGADAFVFTLGLDATSRLFGRGKRTFFNPHLGLRLGVSASFGRVDAVTGVSVGLEVVRLQRLVIDVQVRGLGQWGNRSGPHLGVQSGVTVSMAY